MSEQLGYPQLTTERVMIHLRCFEVYSPLTRTALVPGYWTAPLVSMGNIFFYFENHETDLQMPNAIPFPLTSCIFSQNKNMKNATRYTKITKNSNFHNLLSALANTFINRINIVQLMKIDRGWIWLSGILKKNHRWIQVIY